MQKYSKYRQIAGEIQERTDVAENSVEAGRAVEEDLPEQDEEEGEQVDGTGNKEVRHKGIDQEFSRSHHPLEVQNLCPQFIMIYALLSIITLHICINTSHLMH